MKHNKKWEVCHNAEPNFGIEPRQFSTRGEARYYRDKWNKEYPGHTVTIVRSSMKAINRATAHVTVEMILDAISGAPK